MFVLSSLAVLLMGQITSAAPTSAPVLQVGVFRMDLMAKSKPRPMRPRSTPIHSNTLRAVKSAGVTGRFPIARPTPGVSQGKWIRSPAKRQSSGSIGNAYGLRGQEQRHLADLSS